MTARDDDDMGIDLPGDPGASQAPWRRAELESWWAFQHMYRDLSARVDDFLGATYQLSVADLETLRALMDAEHGALASGELAAAVFYSPSGLTRVVDRLESWGLVVRQESAADRRVTIVRMTTKGSALISSALPEYRRFIRTRVAPDLVAFLRHPVPPDDDVPGDRTPSTSEDGDGVAAVRPPPDRSAPTDMPR